MNRLEALRKLRYMERKIRWEDKIRGALGLRDIRELIDIFENMKDKEYEEFKIKHFKNQSPHID